MTREEKIKNGIEKAVSVMNRMKSSNNVSDSKRRVKITSSLTLEINCIRCEFTGSPIQFEVYAIKKGEDVDCETVELHKDFEEPIEYLLNCYV